MKLLVPILICSVLLNVALLFFRPGPPSRAGAPIATPCPAIASTLTPREAPPPVRQEPTLTVFSTNPQPPERREPAQQRTPEEILRSLGAVNAEQQRGALCEIAEKNIRERWRGERDNITAALIRSLNDEARQQEDLEKKTTELANALGLREADRHQFADRYARLHSPRLEAARAALSKTPVDYLNLLNTVKGLYAEEDALAREFSGDSGVLRVRAAELESRTAILGIIATFADVPWDNSIVW